MLEEKLLLVVAENFKADLFEALFGEWLAGRAFEVVLNPKFRRLAYLQMQVAGPGLCRGAEKFVYFRLSLLR